MLQQWLCMVCWRQDELVPQTESKYLNGLSTLRQLLFLIIMGIHSGPSLLCKLFCSDLRDFK